MPIPAYIELFDSGSGGLTTNEEGTLDREVTLRWLVSSKASYFAAETWAIGQAPMYYKGHRRSRIDLRGIGNGWWEVSASYANIVPPEASDDDNEDRDEPDNPISNTVSIDTTGGTEHITQANTKDNAGQAGASGQAGYARAGETEPDLEGAINVEGDQVRGIDVTVPTFSFSETWTMPSSAMINSYIGTLYELTGTINNKEWRTFKKGEVLFLGARTEITRGASFCAVTFSFQARPTVEDYEIGSGDTKIEVAGKGGWDYQQVTYDTVSEDGSIIKRPKFVYISSVYQGKDFTRLRIGNKFPAVYLSNTGFQ